MRSSQNLQRPVARFNKLKNKPKHNNNAPKHCSAEDRVHAFLSELNHTPIGIKSTKKINYASKSRQNKENMKPNRNSTNTENIQKRASTANHTMKQRNNHKNKQQKSNIKLVQNVIQQRKTSISRPVYNSFNNQNNNNINRNRMCAPQNSQSSSPPKNQTKINQYSLSLQIKNSECEALKNENKELKNENMELKHANQQLYDAKNELETNKQKIYDLQQAFVNKEERIMKLERKLESCGIDPIALKAPQFMDQDTQQTIIFWRERLYKAHQRINDRKMKQNQIIQTAQHYIERLQDV